MNVGVVINSDFPNLTEVRPRKIAKSLNNSGDCCTIFAQKSGEPQKEVVTYAEICRFSWFDSLPLGWVLRAPIPFNPFWILWLAISFQSNDIDVVVGSDVRAGCPAIIAAHLTRTPVVLDLQENNTARQARLSVESPSHIITRNESLIHKLELFCTRFATEVWVVVEERKETLITDGISAEKITIISNTPYLPEMSNQNDGENSWGDTKQSDGFTLVYVGIINKIRGLDLAIKALPKIRASDQSVEIAIAGDGDYLPELKQLATELGVEEHTHFLGRISYTSVPAFLQSGDVGLLMNEVNRAHNTTIPNKIFEYMYAELPVLATNLTPVRRVIEETECGSVLPENATPDDVATAILEMKESDRLSSVGINGKAAIKDQYNWEKEWQKAQKSLQRLSS